MNIDTKKRPSYIDEIKLLIDSFKHQEAITVCEKEIIEDPHDTEALDQMVSIFIDFFDRTQGPPLNRLKMIAMAMRYGRRIDELSNHYFKHMKVFLKGKQRREIPGQIAIGLGPGRNGSTSLAALLGSAHDSYATHEVSPMVYLPPTEEQTKFHLRRIQLLSDYYSLVSDTSHWMLYIRAAILKHFPNVKFIVLKRPPEEIVDSFERVKGNNNHWQDHKGEHWKKTYWDVCYPSYPADDRLEFAEQRRAQIARYVSDYYGLCDKLPKSNRLTISLERLSSKGAQEIGDFLGMPLTTAIVHKNRGGTGDSTSQQRREF